MGKIISSRCQELTDMITNTLLSNKLPGEEYTTISNDLRSILLGKEESMDMSLLKLRNGEASFQFPFINTSTLQNWLGNVFEFGIEVCSCCCTEYMGMVKSLNFNLIDRHTDRLLYD